MQANQLTNTKILDFKGERNRYISMTPLIGKEQIIIQGFGFDQQPSALVLQEN